MISIGMEKSEKEREISVSVSEIERERERVDRERRERITVVSAMISGLRVCVGRWMRVVVLRNLAD